MGSTAAPSWASCSERRQRKGSQTTKQASEKRNNGRRVRTGGPETASLTSGLLVTMPPLVSMLPEVSLRGDRVS